MPSLSRGTTRTEAVCTAQAQYWRAGLRWEVVLQIMYYPDARKMQGVGPFFVVDRAWSEAAARGKTAEINERLARSQREMEGRA